MTAESLRRNRDFQILWSGQVVSALGSRMSGVAFPLLVLALTSSPAKAGATLFAGALPLLLFTLPAGAYVDRVDRKRLMLACEAARFAALGTVPLALWAGRLTFAHILVVAFVDGTAYVFFEVAERAALRQVVPPRQLPAAIAQNQAREYTALLLGQPLGAVLFGAARAAPFVVDAVSYLASAASLLLIRTRLQETREPAAPNLRREIAEGVRFLWRQPLLRTAALLATGNDLALNSLYLVLLVLAKERGASAALIGAMFAFFGVGGVLGAIVAPVASRSLSPRMIVVGAVWAITLLVPLLLVVPGAVPLGVIYGAMFVALPAWNAVLGAYRVALVPDRLQGRVQSVSTLAALGVVPFGALGMGFLLEGAGTTPAIAAVFALMLVVSTAAALSRSLRDAPRLDELESHQKLAL